jgi:hypothetical protein
MPCEAKSRLRGISKSCGGRILSKQNAKPHFYEAKSRFSEVAGVVKKNVAPLPPDLYNTPHYEKETH